MKKEIYGNRHSHYETLPELIKKAVVILSKLVLSYFGLYPQGTIDKTFYESKKLNHVVLSFMGRCGYRFPAMSPCL